MGLREKMVELAWQIREEPLSKDAGQWAQQLALLVIAKMGEPTIGVPIKQKEGAA